MFLNWMFFFDVDEYLYIFFIMSLVNIFVESEWKNFIQIWMKIIKMVDVFCMKDFIVDDVICDVENVKLVLFDLYFKFNF